MFDDLYLLVKESIALQKYIPQIIFFQFIFLHTLQSCHTAKISCETRFILKAVIIV